MFIASDNKFDCADKNSHHFLFPFQISMNIPEIAGKMHVIFILAKFKQLCHKYYELTIFFHIQKT